MEGLRAARRLNLPVAPGDKFVGVPHGHARGQAAGAREVRTGCVVAPERGLAAAQDGGAFFGADTAIGDVLLHDGSVARIVVG